MAADCYRATLLDIEKAAESAAALNLSQLLAIRVAVQVGVVDFDARRVGFAEQEAGLDWTVRQVFDLIRGRLLLLDLKHLELLCQFIQQIFGSRILPPLFLIWFCV